MPHQNGPLPPATVCPYFARFRPRGREHTYDVCNATGEEPLFPSQAELEQLCHGEFTRCPHFVAARAREAAIAESTSEAERRAA